MHGIKPQLFRIGFKKFRGVVYRMILNLMRMIIAPDKYSLNTQTRPFFFDGSSRDGSYMLLSMNAASCDFVNAPTLVASTSPSLNSMSVGMPRTP